MMEGGVVKEVDKYVAAVGSMGLSVCLLPACHSVSGRGPVSPVEEAHRPTTWVPRQSWQVKPSGVWTRRDSPRTLALGVPRWSR